MAFLEQWQIDEKVARKAAIELELADLDGAIKRFILDPTQSYSIGTGQTTQQVTRANFAQFSALRDQLRAEREGIMVALYGSTRSAYFTPGF